MSTQRFAAGIEYSGASYLGWQRQAQGPTVQECVESALSRIAAHPVTVQCAGRTDAGVHAVQQVVHFDAVARRPARAWVLGGNANLPDGISILWAMPVAGDFHARYSAVRRTYRYLILNRAARPGLLCDRVTWEFRPLCAESMAAAAAALAGEHDFSAFRAIACQARNPVRTVHRLEIGRYGQWVIIEIEANGFLHHMVRNIAGVLMEIGRGRRPTEWAGDVLRSRDRRVGGTTAAAAGLYFLTAAYPEHFGIPLPGPCTEMLTTFTNVPEPRHAGACA